MRKLWRELATAYRFALVGVAATAVHVACAALILLAAPEISVFVANIVAFVVAFQVSLIGHRRHTFRCQGNAKKFFAVAAAGFVLNNGLLGALLAATPLRGIAVITVATLSVPVATYAASRLWAFRAERPEPAQNG